MGIFLVFLYIKDFYFPSSFIDKAKAYQYMNEEWEDRFKIDKEIIIPIESYHLNQDHLKCRELWRQKNIKENEDYNSIELWEVI